MGMLASFTAISAEEFKQVQDDPDLMESLLYNDDEDEDDNGEGGSGHPEMDVDKAWHGIHYLLNQSADGGEGPLVGVILGGEPIGDDMGMGPARVLTPAEVKAASQALDALTIEELSSRYDPARMTALDIYPTGMWERDGQEGLDYALHYFKELVTFYHDAAERGDAMVLLIS